MRFLMLCTKYPLDPNDRYFSNELAATLVSIGHAVQVVVTEWDAPYGTPSRKLRSADGVEILAVAPHAIRGLGRFVEKASKLVLSSVTALRDMHRLLNRNAVDVVVAFTPCTALAAQLWWTRSRQRARSVLFIHDFFPYHQRAIGLVPPGVTFQVARLIEENLYRGFSIIGCMSPSNMAYLRRRYRLRASQRVILAPIWTDITPLPASSREELRAKYDIPRDRRVIVFGGQITDGRGVEDILAVAALAKDRYPELLFLFIGDGRLVPLVEKRVAAGLSNVLHRRRIPRQDYLRLLSACDFGLVATVAGVESFAFPTKTLDYLRAGLPIVASVEAESDYRAFLERWHIGVSAPAGSAEALFEAIRQVADDRETATTKAARARASLEAVFDVRKAAERLVRIIDGESEAASEVFW